MFFAEELPLYAKNPKAPVMKLVVSGIKLV
jgi:hypothetical protein